MNPFAQWQQLGSVSPSTLTEPRLELHWAAQAVAAVGQTLVKAAPDYSHTSMEWLESEGALVGQPANFTASFRAALRLADLTLVLLEPGGSRIGEFPLKGRTLSRALEWLAQAIGGYAGQQMTVELERPEYELPAHPAGENGAFSASDQNALQELAHWYGNADGALRELVANTPGASPVRCWPHHFDIATLISLDPGASVEEARSIGVGMTPGDGGYPEPYWYVTPWPYPENPDLPRLAGQGSWHEEGWLGAVLTASRIAKGTAETQAGQVADFLDSAVATCRGLLQDGK